jgi:hypothetical protein
LIDLVSSAAASRGSENNLWVRRPPRAEDRCHGLPLPIHSAWRGGASRNGSHASLDDVSLTSDFWRTVLARCTLVTAADDMRLRSKPNRPRIASAKFWYYQQIDNDRISHSVLNPKPDRTSR